MRKIIFGSLVAVAGLTAVCGTAALAATSNAVTTPGHAGSMVTPSVYTVPTPEQRVVAPLAQRVGYWTPYGYVVTCGWVYGYYGPVRVCR